LEKLATLDPQQFRKLLNTPSPNFYMNPEAALDVEKFFTVVHLSERWRYLPEIMMLRHDCKGEGKFVRSAGGSRPPHECKVCCAALPEHLHFVIQAWADHR